MCARALARPDDRAEEREEKRHCRVVRGHVPRDERQRRNEKKRTDREQKRRSAPTRTMADDEERDEQHAHAPIERVPLVWLGSDGRQRQEKRLTAERGETTEAERLGKAAR